MQSADIDEMITGDTTRTLHLPYAPAPDAKAELKRKYIAGQQSAGALSWIFTGLNTANDEDLVFRILNTTHAPANLNIELFFENRERNIRYIQAKISPLSYKELSVIGDKVESENLYFNWMSLKQRGIPENADFAIRFISDIPLVISHKSHTETYRSN